MALKWSRKKGYSAQINRQAYARSTSHMYFTSVKTSTTPKKSEPICLLSHRFKKSRRTSGPGGPNPTPACSGIRIFTSQLNVCETFPLFLGHILLGLWYQNRKKRSVKYEYFKFNSMNLPFFTTDKIRLFYLQQPYTYRLKSLPPSPVQSSLQVRSTSVLLIFLNRPFHLCKSKPHEGEQLQYLISRFVLVTGTILHNPLNSQFYIQQPNQTD